MKPILMAAVGLLIATSPAALFGGDLPADAKAKLDDSLKALASYDFGGDKTALNTIESLVAASHGHAQFRKDMAAKLAAILGTDAPHGAKDFACRQLAIIGAGESVPALAALLTDEKLSHMARFALERIPGPAADEALRGALDKVKSKTLIGVINSIGARRDAKAVGALATLLSDADAAVAGAAAGALGKIGGPAATGALTKALADVPAPVKPSVADGCLLCADRLLAQGNKKEATAICQRLRGKDFPKAIRVAATRMIILARGSAGVPLLVAQLKSNDP
ncbi:MAG: HEAT repeat domain-containing protein, partial [Verrucomicrobiae bacterium]|nr:HEAT repeat domain-containing protein [Verrucomicrobiae bacterium]